MTPTVAVRRSRALIAAVAAACCLAGIGNAFVQDDVPILTEDPRVHDITAWGRFLTEPYWPPPYAPDQYRPLSSVILSAQYIAGAGSPVVIRVVSCLLYVVSSLLVFAFARRAIGRDTPALLAALLFAAHPVHVEATALGVAQAELLAAIFTLAGVNRYLDARQRGMRRRDWLTLAGLYVAAALSKEQGLLFPAFLLVAELLVPQERRGARIRDVWRGYGGIALVGAALVAVRLIVLGDLTPTNVAEVLEGRDLGTRGLTALRLVPEWLRLLVWPAHLRLDYSAREFTASTGFGGYELLGAAIITVTIAGALAARRRTPAITAGIAWCAVALFPVSNVLIATGVLVAERTLFLPSIGFVVMLGGILAFAQASARPRFLTLVHAAAVILVLAGITRSVLRQRDWRDNEALTRAAIRDSPRSWRANANYGDLMFRNGALDSARALYSRAVAFAPSPWWVRHTYARHLYAAGDYGRAIEQLATSLAEFPNQPDVLRDAIATLIALGQYGDAERIAGGMVSSGRATPEIVRLGRLADSARTVGAPAGTIRVDIGQPTAGIGVEGRRWSGAARSFPSSVR